MIVKERFAAWTRNMICVLPQRKHAHDIQKKTLLAQITTMDITDSDDSAAVLRRNAAPTPKKVRLSLTKGEVMKHLETEGREGSVDFFEHLDPEFRDDEDVVLKGLEEASAYLLRHASARLLGDPDFMIKAVRLNPYSVRYASGDLRQDHDFMIKVIGVDWQFFEYTSPHLFQTKAFLVAAVSTNGSVYTQLPVHLQSDTDVAMAALLTNCDPPSMKRAPDSIKANKAVMLQAVRSVGCLEYVWSKLDGDRDFTLQACTINGLCLRYTYSNFRDDEEVVRAAVQQNGLCLRHASGRLQRDRAVVLQAVRRDGRAVEYAGHALRNDYEILEAVYMQDGSNWDNVRLREQVGLADDPNLLATAIRYAPRHTSIRWQGSLGYYHKDSVVFMADHLAGFAERNKKTVPELQPTDWEGSVFVRYAKDVWKRALYEKIWDTKQLFPSGVSQSVAKFMTNKDEFKAADALIKYAPLLASITLTQGLTWNDFVGGIGPRSRFQRCKCCGGASCV